MYALHLHAHFDLLPFVVGPSFHGFDELALPLRHVGVGARAGGGGGGGGHFLGWLNLRSGYL
jgi:hypothetical protein